MLIENKIRRRIKLIESIKGKKIEEVKITKEEAQELKGIKEIDGVKLILIEDNIKKDCFSYLGNGDCYGLNYLYCSKEKCKFYRTDLKVSKIEHDIREYANRKER